MADFVYTARTASGQLQKGTITAHSKISAMEALKLKQLHPIIVKEAHETKGLQMNIALPGLERVKTKEIVIFTRELSTMINAGVPLLRCLGILKNQTESVYFKKVLSQVISDIEAGSNLNVAMSKHPKAFSTIYISMVKAGETGGILDKVLNRLAYQQEKESALRGKIAAAMVYPAVIFSVTIIAFIILMTFIVPKIGSILTQLSNGKAKLPIYTRALLGASHIMRQPVFIAGLFIGLPVCIILFRRYIKTENGRYNWHLFLLKIPVVKVLITKTAVARFASTFGSLLAAGVSIIEAIDTTSKAIGNAVIEKDLMACSYAVERGSSLSSQLEKSEHFPEIVTQMLAVGEETGQTDQMILKIAEFYEEEVDSAVSALSSIIEPIMIILLGTMVGLIAISVFGPITKVETTAQ